MGPGDSRNAHERHTAVISGPFSLVITDLDNTLFDWFVHWLAGFSVLVEAAQRDSGASRDDVLSAARVVHRRHKTSEYAFLPHELPSELPALRWSEARAAEVSREVERARREHLELYPGVMATLVELKRRGVALVGYTESMAVYTAHRLKALDLDGVLDAVYSPQGHDVPRGLSPDAARFYAEGWSALNSTSHRYTPPGQIKPAPEVLKTILGEFGTPPPRAVYVGDSLMKDIAMAQAVGTADAYARYGVVQAKAEYDLLRQVTHWTAEDVERERRLQKADVEPSCTLEASYDELLRYFDFRGAPRA